MYKKSIVILGDSTSMSIGLDGISYPYILSESKIWSQNTQIINCSIPGFTSSDLCAFFFRHLKSFAKIEAVILYTGNCDTMSSELERPRYSYYYQYKNIFKQIFIKKKPLKLNNKLLHFKWHNTFDQSIEKPTPIKNFSFNIERIIKYCLKKSIPIIMINPTAHQHFPSGIGNGNFMFYHYYDINDNMSQSMVIDDKCFIKAYQYFENQEFNKAADIYHEILLNPDCLSNNLEYQTLIVNNYAVCRAKLSDFNESEYLLNLIKNEMGVRKEIILYNLAIITKVKGDEYNYQKLIKESYESDTLMYRIREPYRLAIQNIANKYQLPLLDIKSITNDDSFIDHCHLLSDFHQKLADFIINQLQHSGSERSDLNNQLYNPEYALGNNSQFEDYFGIFSKLLTQEINHQINLIKDNPTINVQDNATLHNDIKNAIKHISKHPCFNNLNNILLANPQYPSDVGRFSEFFTVRFLIPHITYLESIPSLQKQFINLDNLLRNSKKLKRILPKESHQYIDEHIIQLSGKQAKEWVNSIFTTCYEQLLLHLSKGSQIDNRLKTVIFWYFREALRFGSHSRFSMRYERITLEYITEALAFASIIDIKYLNSQYNTQIIKFLDFLKQIIHTHNKYTNQFIPGASNSSLVMTYNNTLNNIYKDLQDSNIC